MDAHYACGKCGRLPLPHTRVVCVAVHRSPYGSLGTMLWGVCPAVWDRPNVEPAVHRTVFVRYYPPAAGVGGGPAGGDLKGVYKCTEHVHGLQDHEGGKRVNAFRSPGNAVHRARRSSRPSLAP